MNESVFQDAGILLKDSPFIWRNGQSLYCENTNDNCTYEQIEKMKEKRLLNAVDFFIMREMAAYKYLSLTHINYCVNHSKLSAAYKKNSYEKNIKKLVHAGIINKFCFISVPTTENGTEKYHYSIHFYDLSRGAYSYMRSVEGSSVHHLEHNQSPDRVLELLSLNQFDIGLRHQSSLIISSRHYVSKRKVGSSLVNMDLCYRLSTQNATLPLQLYVISIRSYPSCREVFCEKVMLIRKRILYSDHEVPTVILVLCDSLELIKSLYAYQLQEEAIKNEIIFFTTDITNYVFGALNSIILCQQNTGRLFYEHLRGEI